MYLGRPSIIALLINCFVKVLVGRWSLNEALYYDRKRLSVVMGDVRDASFVYSDMIRMAPYASVSQSGFHLDMDDLLSLRYEKFSTSNSVGFGFSEGFFNGGSGALVLRLIKRVSAYVFKLESNLISKREIYWANTAKTVSLVSPDECAELERKSNINVFNLPMAISSPSVRWKRRSFVEKGLVGVFVGSIDIPGNYLSIEKYLSMIRRNGAPFKLRVIGVASDSSIGKLSHPDIEYLGYVEDMDHIFLNSDFVFCPIHGGTGIKTKVVEALSYGIPVLTTQDGLSGLAIPEELVFKFDLSDNSIYGLEERYTSLASDSAVDSRINYFATNFGSDIIHKKWCKVFMQYQA